MVHQTPRCHGRQPLTDATTRVWCCTPSGKLIGGQEQRDKKRQEQSTNRVDCRTEIVSTDVTCSLEERQSNRQSCRSRFSQTTCHEDSTRRVLATLTACTLVGDYCCLVELLIACLWSLLLLLVSQSYLLSRSQKTEAARNPFVRPPGAWSP